MSNNLSENKTVFHRDESHLHNVGTKLIVLLFLAMLLMIVAFIFTFVFFFSGRYLYSGICCAITVVCIIFGKICDHMNWYTNLTYTFTDNGFDYSYDLDSAVLPVSKSTVHIKVSHIDYFVRNNKTGKIMIHGDIKKMAPMSKTKLLTEYQFTDIPEKTQEIEHEILTLSNK